MIIAVLALVLIVSPALAGGSLTRYADLRLRHGWVLAVALLAQLLVLSIVADGFRPALAVGHVATYAAAGWFVWTNRSVPGLWLLGLGTMFNGVTIALNGGTLPASPSALRLAGLDPVADGFVNSGVRTDPVLPWLGDVFAIPAGWPLANVFSVGDVLILAGLGWGAQRICGSGRHRAGQRRRDSSTTATAPPANAPSPASIATR